MAPAVPSEFLPWVAVRAGRALSPTGQPGGEGEAESVVRAALKAHEALLVWDLDGMERGRPRLDLYRRFEGRGLWVDAGVRDLETLIDVLVGGAEVAVLNLRYLARPRDLGETGTLTEKAALCVEEDREVLARDRSLRKRAARDLFRRATEVGIRRGVYLRYGGLGAPPPWADDLKELDLYAGPVERPAAHTVVDYWRLA